MTSYLFLNLVIRFTLSQIANAARYGATAALLYSDPADYALEGYSAENTYPNTPWLPSTGAQRGSLYKGPGDGDPQTPGLPSLKGFYRRSLNDSDLPPIPAHPMSYGDAIHFLSAMGGWCLFYSLNSSVIHKRGAGLFGSP